jgi:glycosyltransferase involved in cell wall biosynthesis/2-polyprenyl-3-methyl-5-hydroxy-6-metoxy-1,4-benzoquinol methylase
MSRNLIFVGHCDFHGNSAMHLFSIANVLTDLGHSCAVCVPGRPETVLDHGEPRFQVLDHDEAVLRGVSFANRQGPDLIHAWTPRELVRRTTMSLVQRYKVPYFVHFEDNETIVLLDELPGWSREDLERLPAGALDVIVADHRTHPHHSRRLLAGAAGVTALIDRLLEFKPAEVPGIVFFPGYDATFAKIDSPDEELRVALGIVPDQLLVVYTGNVHNSNFQEVRSLVLAVALVNRRGFRVKLVKTGWNYYVLPELSDPEIAQHVIDRGFVARSEIHRLLAAADVLVQPGRSNEFNDYRFPSKLPEFLASGRPVILPRSNVGLLLKNGEEALILGNGHSADIADALQRLAIDAGLRARIGHGGRAFALRNLDWVKNVAAIPSFYDDCLKETRREVHSSPEEEPVVPKLIAFYLPQFHPIPENDAWWGKGFTEWANTAAARPNFEGHVQPRLPADLGFYDLRLPETMDAQVELARQFGVSGFCFYYYWFNGRRLLERPLDQFLVRGKPDFPFCICWANENWTRRWDGLDEEVLIKQEYGEDFSFTFIRDVIPILKDARYVKVRSEPVLLVYRLSLLPDPRATAEIWRAECRKAGIPSVHLVAVQSFGISDPRPFGFDAAVEFPPHTRRFLIDTQTFGGVNPAFEGYLEDYRKVVNDQLAKPFPDDYTLYRGVMPSWDNTPRRKQRAHILVNSSPADYQAWLRRVTAQAIAFAEAQEPLIFVNAWNEWAEGAILEPDAHNGHAFLEATHAGLTEGFADQLRARGIRIDEAAVSKLLMPGYKDIVRFEPLESLSRRPHKTDVWFTDEQLNGVTEQYRERFKTEPLSYATVRDFCDSFDHLYPIATANGDLKDNQRPWILKAILGVVPPGGRVLEIGAGEPFIADILDRLGYEVWVVDPYDGTGNGPIEYERFRAECPSVHFIRCLFGEQVLSAPSGGFDCIYSISVLEHIPAKALEGAFAGLKKYLQPNGWSIHAIDHVHKGSGAVEHFEKLKSMVRWSGFDEIELMKLLERMDADQETYYLSAESHNRWRGSLSYDAFPMRVCVSIQIVARAEHLHLPKRSSPSER